MSAGWRGRASPKTQRLSNVCWMEGKSFAENASLFQEIVADPTDHERRVFEELGIHSAEDLRAYAEKHLHEGATALLKVINTATQSKGPRGTPDDKPVNKTSAAALRKVITEQNRLLMGSRSSEMGGEAAIYVGPRTDREQQQYYTSSPATMAAAENYRRSIPLRREEIEAAQVLQRVGLPGPDPLAMQQFAGGSRHPLAGCGLPPHVCPPGL